MDQSGQNPKPNGADISSSFPTTNQWLVPSERSRQIMTPLAAIARPEPNLLWPSQFSQSYTQMPSNVSIQNVLVMPPYSTGNVSPVHEVGNNVNQSTYTPYLSPHFGSHLVMRQPSPYGYQAAFPFHSYATPFQASPLELPVTYPQNRIASTSYYSNGAGGSFSSESSLAVRIFSLSSFWSKMLQGALSHTRAVNSNSNRIMSNNLDSGTSGQARIDNPFDPDTRINNKGGSEGALPKEDVSLQSFAPESINFPTLDEVLADDNWKNEASNRIVQTLLTPSDIINTPREKSTPVSVQVPINSSLKQGSVPTSTSLVGPSSSLQREFFSAYEPSRNFPTPPNILQSSAPQTPPNHQPRNLITPSSGSANRATLARDILWALQPASLKRKRPVNEDRPPVAISNKKSKAANIDPSISDVVPTGSTPLPSFNDVSVQVLEPETNLIYSSLATTKVDREISSINADSEPEIPSSNQPDKAATGFGDLPALPFPDVLEVDAQTPPPSSLKLQLDQPAIELNDNLLPLSPQAIPGAFDIKIQTSFGIPVGSQADRVAMESSNLLPSRSPSVSEVRVRTPLFLPSESPSPIRQRSLDGSLDDEPLAPPKKALHTDDNPSRSIPLPDDKIKIVRKNIRPYVLIPKLRSLFIKDKKPVVSQPPGNIGRGKRAVESECPEVQDSRSRLTVRRCLWRDCPAILDSAEKLIKHTKVVHGSIIYKCQWADCRLGTYFTPEDLKSHLKRHIQLSITCPYEDCAYETKRGDSLVDHISTNHSTRRDSLKPFAIPIDRSTPKYVESIEIHPAYYSILIPTMAKQISIERHFKLGPLIRNQVIGKSKPEKHNFRTMTSTRSSSPLTVDDYDFQQEESASKTFSSLRQVSPTVNEIDVLEGSLLDSVVIMEIRSDGNSLPKTASNAKANSSVNLPAQQLEGGLGIDLGPNILQTAREEHESLEVESLL
ncbi:hypothetical protein Clacol_001539 [Clathrus columnatus]|uniref:C2H2-type domain-containing protein n=1 Tax=Clathrus columnatus TaxID=1419009 RepID=A0AAV5A1I6_9AGAM|nr:hypothetical protein Clacol_001539 [Clathrus columnatus]